MGLDLSWVCPQPVDQMAPYRGGAGLAQRDIPLKRAQGIGMAHQGDGLAGIIVEVVG